MGRTLIFTWAGAMLRCLSVAVLLLAAVDRSLGAGLWALGGFMLARVAWTALIALGIGGGKAIAG